jgi:hypothetical protein
MQTNIASERETVKIVNRVSRHYAVAPQSRQSLVSGMRDLEAKRRGRLKLFIDSFGRRKLNWVAGKAGVAESTLRQYLKGTSSYLEEPTYDKLATWSRWTVPELKGDAPAPSSDDIASRKSHNGTLTTNDLERNVSHSADLGASSDSHESEGEVAADRLFIDILDKIEGLPPTHLSRLKRILDRIEGAAGHSAADPQKAGTAE